MEFEVGDKVSLLDEDALAYVLEILPKGNYRVELDDDFSTQMVVSASKLAPYSDISTYKTNKIKKKDTLLYKGANTGASTKVQKLSQQALSKHVLEVDLHIEKLVGSKAALMNSEMLEIQLRKVSQVLTENRNNRGLKIILIHGNGKGVLKNEILKLLKRNFSTYKISDASMQKYGTGALEVQV
jgi:dsDNA-specific endonuclease/ATPase MutS2